MPLIKIAKLKKEAEYEFTEYEKYALNFIPQEQVKSANHEEHLIDLMLDAEKRDANPERTLQDIYKALENRDQIRLLKATKNLTVAEKNKIVQGIYQYLLREQKDSFFVTTRDGKTVLNDAKLSEDAKRILILEQGSVDLFDLCIKLDIRNKKR